MNFIKEFVTLCESNGVKTCLKETKNKENEEKTDQTSQDTVNTSTQTTQETQDDGVNQVQPTDKNGNDVHTVDGNPQENPSKPLDEQKDGPVHFALVANIRNGLFKKDQSVFVCHIGSTDSEGNIVTTNRLTENDGERMCWNGKNDDLFGGYTPNQNDADWISNFMKCGKNADILKKVKDHYGQKFRCFSIQEYYPKDSNETFVDYIDPAVLRGICPYCQK